MYTQCKLVKNDIEERMAFIPDKFAKLGKTLQLKLNGEWNDGWVVRYVGTSVSKAPNVRESIKTHRKNSGDSIRKEK